MAEVTTDAIRTKRIEIVDDLGKVRIVLGLVGYGDSEDWGVAVKDERGDDATCLTADRERAELVFVRRGNVVAAFGVDGHGSAEVTLCDANGSPVAGIGPEGRWLAPPSS